MENISCTNSSNQLDIEKNYKASSLDSKNVGFEDKSLTLPLFDNKPETKNNTDKTVDDEKQSLGETLEDMLEDDLLRLSPEDEELLLSDEEDLTLPISFSKTLTSTSVENFENKVTSITKIVAKDSTKVANLLSSNAKLTAR